MIRNSMDNNIPEIKSDFIRIYMWLTIATLLFFAVLFQFFIVNKIVSFYLISGAVVLSFFAWFSTYKYYPDRYIKTYLILAPLFVIYILVTFWENSVASFVILFPIVFAAYIFLDRKTVLYLAIYIFAIFVGCYVIYSSNIIDTPLYTRNEAVITDAFLFTYNIGVFVLLFVCKEKLDRLRLLENFQQDSKRSLEKVQRNEIFKIVENEIDTDEANELIIRLKKLMEKEKLYRDSNIEISKVSLELDVNYSYLSKIIRYKGFNNFNYYINTYRIKYVKQLLDENDLEKITLMYIYTEAGFKNQSTFNRVFKQIEGLTPSEYIKKLNAENNEIS